MYHFPSKFSALGHSFASLYRFEKSSSAITGAVSLSAPVASSESDESIEASTETSEFEFEFKLPASASSFVSLFPQPTAEDITSAVIR